MTRWPHRILLGILWPGFLIVLEAPAQQPVAPVILQGPIAQTLDVDAVATLSVTAGGTPQLQYQWRLNGVNVPGATNATLVLNRFQATNAGSYSVAVANSAGAINSQPVTLAPNIPFLNVRDRFADRTLLGTSNGVFRASTADATREVGEPNHAGNRGGKSVWFSWRAPVTGVVTFRTAGSDFDTLLALYTGSVLTNLVPVIGDDEAGGFHTSAVLLDVQAGTVFQIAVAGFNGASGDVVLSWNLEPTSDCIPYILGSPRSKTAGFGEDLTLVVDFSSRDTAQVLWLFNGQPLGVTTPELVIKNLNAASVGRYAAFISTRRRQITTVAADVQINQRADGTTDSNIASQIRLAETSNTQGAQLASARLSRIRQHSAPARGYTGTQVFSTYGAAKEEGEPNHCGVIGGASEWFSYQAAADGTLTIDTYGSTFDTVLAVYTGPGDGFDTLLPTACNNDDGTNRTSKVVFSATRDTVYWIAVDGVGAATGTVMLHYNLSGGSPTITAHPQSQTVNVGSNVTLSVTADGSPPLQYQWRLNGANISGATGVTLTLNNVQPAAAGNYSVVVSNSQGIAVSAAATLTVNVPPIITLQPVSRTVSEGGAASLTVAATGTPAPVYRWQFNQGDLAGATGTTLTITNFQAANQGDYRVVVSNAQGSVISDTAQLLLSLPLRLGSVGVSTNGTFSFQLVGSANTNYVIQASSNLVDWVSLATTNAATGIVEFTDNSAPGFRLRYYRAVPSP